MEFMKGSLAIDPKKKYTYKDYLKWPEDERWELIEGIPYDMSPAPRIIHQEIVGKLYRILADYLDNYSCEVYLSPLDVVLQKDWDDAKDADENAETVVQPDLIVLCDSAKITERNCNGAPDLVVEVLSPSTGYKDMTTKYKLYEKNAVREYWIVNPDIRSIMIYPLEGNEYSKPDVYKGNETLQSRVLDSLELDLSRIWASPIPS